MAQQRRVRRKRRAHARSRYLRFRRSELVLVGRTRAQRRCHANRNLQRAQDPRSRPLDFAVTHRCRIDRRHLGRIAVFLDRVIRKNQCALKVATAAKSDAFSCQ